MNRNTLIAVVIGLVLLLIAGYMLFAGSAAGGSAVEGSAVPNEAESAFVNLTAQLEPLGFDTSILNDPRFTALVDIHTAVIPEPTGRRDPFAPI